MPRLPLLVVALCLLAAAPAGAVVGGSPLEEAQVPWFANLGCGGSLVAPDRVLTAAHCVGEGAPAGLTVAGQVRTIKGVSLAPGWRHPNGRGLYLDDVALVLLSEPVDGVPIVALGGKPDPAMKIIGRGYVNAPGSGRPESENFHAVLRQATLRTLSDRACAKAYRHRRGNGGERFDGSRMICAIDPDGRAPLSSGCNGDSGGPLMAGTYEAPRVVGVVSYGGSGCGKDHLPSVFAEVQRYRSFILSPHPVLAPQTTVGATVEKQGRRLTCTAPAFANKVVKADRGYVLTCEVRASNAGGHGSAWSKPLRIPR
jgi:secreted trypsin-like serine protease